MEALFQRRWAFCDLSITNPLDFDTSIKQRSGSCHFMQKGWIKGGIFAENFRVRVETDCCPPPLIRWPLIHDFACGVTLRVGLAIQGLVTHHFDPSQSDNAFTTQALTVIEVVAGWNSRRARESLPR
jgi:hypothetical protein